MGPTLSRNAQLVKFFAQQYRGIPRKRLVKMVYLADVIGRQYLGRPLSSMTWLAYSFGPYSNEIPNAIAELEQLGLGWTEAPRVSEDIAWKKLFDAGKPTVFGFTPGEHEVLGFIVATYLSMPMEELLDDVVYASRPYQKAERFGQPLPMELEDGQGLRDIGFDLEAVLRAERQAEEGNALTVREYFSGLRDRITARYAN